ncbi:MAG: site-2 protease family protein [Pseudomonadota bacterium]
MLTAVLPAFFRRVPVTFHWSLVLLPVLLLAFDALGLRPFRGVGEEAIYLALIFASILLHELGHVVAAHAMGIRTQGVTLHLLGGAAKLAHQPQRPLQELAIVLAGPAVNVTIAVGLLALRFSGAIPSGSMASELAIINLAIALFNMLPLFPLDGARALRAGLALVLGRLRATTWAASGGVILGTGLLLASMHHAAPVIGLAAVLLALASYVEGKAALQLASRSVEGDRQGTPHR